MFDFPKFTCSSGLTQGRAGEVTPEDSAETELAMVGGLRWCLPAGTESQRSQEHIELVHRPSHSHLM